MNLASRILLGGEVPTRTIENAELSTFVTVDDGPRRYTSFAWRLLLSSVIATGGIAAGSNAVVIGAMLIAPLMSPMVGTTLAVVTGNAKAAFRTLAITASGVAGSIAVAAAVAAIIPVDVDTASNSEVLARVSPRLVDLIVALAAGLTASLAAIREDIPDAVPGIAISASIVPPLCVVGVSLFEGDVNAAFWAFILFSANYFAIQIMGIAVFLAVGLGERHPNRKSDRTRKAWYATAAIGLAAVSVPLAMASFDMASQVATERTIRETAVQWVETTPFEIRSMKIDEDEVILAISGSGTPPSAEDFHRLLIEQNIEIARVRMAVAEEQVSESVE